MGTGMKHFVARVQKSGRTYYYFSVNGKPRREIPLGSDYVAAARKWAELISGTFFAHLVPCSDKMQQLAVTLKRDRVGRLVLRACQSRLHGSPWHSYVLDRKLLSLLIPSWVALSFWAQPSCQCSRID